MYSKVVVLLLVLLTLFPAGCTPGKNPTEGQPLSNGEQFNEKAVKDMLHSPEMINEIKSIVTSPEVINEISKKLSTTQAPPDRQGKEEGKSTPPKTDVGY